MSGWEEVRGYFERAAVVHLATLMADGAPHSVPVWADAVDGGIAFFTVAGSLKDRNLQRDPRAAVSVTRPDQPLDMAVVRGTVITRLEGAEAMTVVDRISHAYTGADYPERSGFVAYLLRPDRAWGNDYTDD